MVPFLHHEHARTSRSAVSTVLLNQQDRYACLIDVVDLTPDPRNKPRHDASVGSSKMIKFGRIMRQRAMASICCSPPDNVLPACLRTSLIGEEAAENVFFAFWVAAPARRPMGEDSPTPSAGKMPAALWA